MIAKIDQLLQEVERITASNAEELEALRIKYLSKKGAINELMADFRNVPAEQKKEVGMKLNTLKTKAQEKIAALKEQFESQDNGAEGIDLTRTAYPMELGTRHPLTIVKNEIIDIARKIGTLETSQLPYEDCCTVFTPRHPKTRPNLAQVERAEQFEGAAELYKKALENVRFEKI